jgi:hypothetical protein
MWWLCEGRLAQACFYRLECARGEEVRDDAIYVYCAYFRQRDPKIALFVMCEVVGGGGEHQQLRIVFQGDSVHVVSAWSIGKMMYRAESELTVASRVSQVSIWELRT